MQLDYQLIDIDNHYYEPYDAFTRYIEPEFEKAAVNIRKGPNGLGQVWIGDRRLASASDSSLRRNSSSNRSSASARADSGGRFLPKTRLSKGEATSTQSTTSGSCWVSWESN